MIWIGIDPGTSTGIAVWDSDNKRFRTIVTFPIHRALGWVHEWARHGNARVVFEDARLRTWYGTRTAEEDRAKLQGAGSVKRDSAIWEDALKDWGFPYERKAPKNSMTKLPAETFRRITGWTKRTSAHARDAAMLVFGR